jgi:hypothetical protein
MAIEKSSVFRPREASEDPHACTTGGPLVPQMCSHPPIIRLSAVARRRFERSRKTTGSLPSSVHARGLIWAHSRKAASCATLPSKAASAATR